MPKLITFNFGKLTDSIKAQKSRNHSEILFRNLKIPIKLKKGLRHDFINIKGLTEFKSFNYRIPGDISSSSFFIVLTLLTKNSELLRKYEEYIRI